MTSEQGTHDDRDDVVEAVAALELPLALINLSDFTVEAISNAGLKYLERPAASVVGYPVFDLLPETDRAKATAELEAMRDGAIDFYGGHLMARAPSGAEVPSRQWVRAVRFSGKSFAFIEVAPGAEARTSPLGRYLGRVPLTMAIGIVDSSWTITSISSEVVDLLDIAPNDLVGRLLLGAVGERDVGRLLDAGLKAGEVASVALGVKLRNGSGSWTQLRCVLTSLAGSGQRCFMLFPDTPLEDSGTASNRVEQLEVHLRRIAAEVEASGILVRLGSLPDARRFPEFRSLSLRQWEVLSRLLKGERVSTIAAALVSKPKHRSQPPIGDLQAVRRPFPGRAARVIASRDRTSWRASGQLVSVSEGVAVGGGTCSSGPRSVEIDSGWSELSRAA